jgi:hypothetical protein
MVTTLTGAVFIYKDVNWTYWVGPSVKVSTISGALYNQFISTWNAAVNQSYPYYNMFAIMEKFGGKEYVEGWDCFDYVFAAFQYLHGTLPFCCCCATICCCLLLFTSAVAVLLFTSSVAVLLSVDVCYSLSPLLLLTHCI